MASFTPAAKASLAVAFDINFSLPSFVRPMMLSLAVSAVSFEILPSMSSIALIPSLAF